MNVLIDLSPVRTGGGMQLAINFLKGMQWDNNINAFVIVNESISIDLVDGAEIIGVCPNRLTDRFLFEYFTIPKLISNNSISKIFTFFGSGLPRVSGAKRIVGVAYPIICYDDSEYWKFVPVFERMKKRVWNKIRISRLKKADVIICETQVMSARLKKVVGMNSNIEIFPPTVTSFLDEIPVAYKPSSPLRILILSGLAYHKNIWRLYDVAVKLTSEGISTTFVCSLDRSAFSQQVALMTNSNVDSKVLDTCFEFVGSVSPDKIASLYSSCSALMNVSDLESFSNNYMEAWKASVLLICSDRDFAHAICRDSAVYCEPHSLESVVSVIKKVASMGEYEYLEKVSLGKEYLSEMPTLDEKNQFLYNLLSK